MTAHPINRMRSCAQCHAMYTDPHGGSWPRAYHSAECARAARAAARLSPLIERTYNCDVCGESFVPRTGFQRYCGRRCRIESQRETATCAECGEAFRGLRKNATRVPQFCSNTCSNRAQAKRRQGLPGRFGMGSIARFPVKAECAACGVEYSKTSGRHRFCSRACGNRSRHATKRAAQPSPSHWSIRTKGEEACRNCGRPAVHLHHIVPRSKSTVGRNNWLENGLPLCFACHNGWHYRRVSIVHSVLTDIEFAFMARVTGALWIERNYPDDPVDALMRLDEIVNGRILSPTRGETLDERLARVGDGSA